MSPQFENNEAPAKIIGIQFSIMSPEEILKNSVVEVQLRDTYLNNNKPVLHGLFDPRMGTLEANQICPTDYNDYFKCPGYFGHIKLARPVFYIQFMQTMIKILKCICFKCSKLLIDKAKYKYLLNLPNQDRWDEVSNLASKIKRCGEDTEDGCSCKQPNKIKRADLITLMVEWDAKDGNTGIAGEMTTNEEKQNDEGDQGQGNPQKISMKLTAEIVLKIFKRISDDDVHFMGFNPVWTRPEWMICEVLAVPPPSIRPSIKHDGQARAEDDLTYILIHILKTNNILLDKIKQNANINQINDTITLLQYYISAQIDNKIPGTPPMAQRSGRTLKSIKERLNGKTGRVRQNLMGKRVDYSARSVITPDPNIKISELGVPLQIAKNITKPVYVNNKNKAFLMQLVKNGPNRYPGAKILDKKSSNISQSLGYVDADTIVLEEGDVVHRHMLDGDYVLFNRQPTVHRMSMMAHRVKVLHKGNSFRLNVAVTTPYNADFDRTHCRKQGAAN